MGLDGGSVPGRLAESLSVTHLTYKYLTDYFISHSHKQSTEYKVRLPITDYSRHWATGTGSGSESLAEA